MAVDVSHQERDDRVFVSGSSASNHSVRNNEAGASGGPRPGKFTHRTLQDTRMRQRYMYNATFPFRWANQNDGRPVRRTCFVECSPNTPRWQFRVTCTADTRYVNEWRHAASRDVTIARRAASGTRKTSASLERRCKRQSVTVHVLRRVTLQREQLRPCRTSICNLYQLFPVISYTLY